MKKYILLSILLITSLSGCDVVKQLTGAYQFTQCEFSYNSISRINVAGTSINMGSPLSLVNIAKLSSIFTINSNSIPLSFTLNLDVKNPNQSEASLTQMSYILELNDIELTSGNVNSVAVIAPNGTSVLPLDINFNLKTIMDKHSRETIAPMISSLLGITSSDQKNKITIKVLPSFNIGNSVVASPIYMPITFYI